MGFQTDLMEQNNGVIYNNYQVLEIKQEE